MDFLEWVEGMRKKPIAERRRFVAIATIAVMGAVAAVWFAFFLADLPQAAKDVPQLQISEPELPPFPQLDPDAQSFLKRLGF